MKVVSQKLRDSARGRECTLRLPGVCNFDPATTVLCHIPVNQRGMGIKSPDIAACFACSSCHDAADGRTPYNISAWDWLRAMIETQLIWIAEGLLTVEGMKEKAYKPIGKIVQRQA